MVSNENMECASDGGFSDRCSARSEPGSTSFGRALSDESLRLGTEAIRAGRILEAEKYFQAAVKDDPENPEALMELGVAELRLGKPELASDLLGRAVARSPEMQGANLFLGIAYAQMHQVDQCVAALKREVELNPKNAQAYMWMGVVELQDGHPEKATEPLDRAAELAPDDLNILEYRGQAHNDVGFRELRENGCHRSKFVACAPGPGPDLFPAEPAQRGD